MPSTSKAQQAVMAIAEHHPEKLHAKNRGVLSMTHSQLHDFAATPTTKLPTYARSNPHTAGLRAAVHQRSQ